MHRIESLQELKALKRVQLQKLCKSHGIKASGKNIEMIAALKRVLLKPEISQDKCNQADENPQGRSEVFDGKIEPENELVQSGTRRHTYELNNSNLTVNGNQNLLELQANSVNDNLSVGKIQADLMLELGERVAARKAITVATDEPNNPTPKKILSVQKGTNDCASKLCPTRKRAQSTKPANNGKVAKENDVKSVNSQSSKTRKRAQNNSEPVNGSKVAKKNDMKSVHHPSSKKTKSKVIKMPNFSKLHEQNFSKFGESLDNYLDRKEKRRQFLTEKLQSAEKVPLHKGPAAVFSSQIPKSFNFSMQHLTELNANKKTPNKQVVSINVSEKKPTPISCNKTTNKRTKKVASAKVRLPSNVCRTPSNLKTPGKRVKSAVLSINQPKTPSDRIQNAGESAFQRRKNYDLSRRKTLSALSAKKAARGRTRTSPNLSKNNIVSHQTDVKQVKIKTREERRNNTLRDRSKKRDNTLFARRGIQLR